MLLLSPAVNVATQALVESVAFVARLSSRRSIYERARCRADQAEKPLVVVGARTSGYVTGSTSQYRCGDLPCVDLAGCDDCGAPPVDLASPGSIDVADGGAIVCVQCVLEYVGPNDAAFQRAWTEVKRAAGDPRDVFVCRVQGWATATRVGTGCRRILDECPPSASGRLVYHEVRLDGRRTARGDGRRLL